MRSISLWTAALIAALVLVASSCGGSGRSTEAFCSTYQTEQQRLMEKYQGRADLIEEQQPLVGLFAGVGSLIEAQGDFVVLLDRLEKVAPEEIAPEVAALRDAAQEQTDALASGDLGRMAFGGLVTLMQVQGSAERVDRYIVGNC